MISRKNICLKFILILAFSSLFIFNNNSGVFAEEDIDSFREYIFGIDQEDAKITFSPKFIKVIRGDEVKIYTTSSSDATSALEENGYSFSHDSKIFSYSNGSLANFSVIQIIKLKTEIETRYIDIPYSKRIFDSWQYPLGQEIIEQKGVLGVKEQRVQSFFEDGVLVKEVLISEDLISEPVEEIIALGSSSYTLEGITQRGYNCKYWYSVVDSGNYSAKEKQWMKFVMYCESGCNAESNKGFYKGLFQWSPTLWKRLYPENIFDGHAQIKHTVEKLRAGADPLKMWPACTKKYEDKYGPY